MTFASTTTPLSETSQGPTRGSWTAVVASAVLLVSGPSMAGNLDAYFIGNAAGLTAGAITAFTRDTEALWYNPAGLAGAGLYGQRRNTLEVSGTAFALRYRPLSDTIGTNLNLEPAVPGDPELTVVRSPVDVSFDTVGTSLLFARQLTPTVGLGFGLVVPVKDRLRTSDSFSKRFELTGFPTPLEYEQRTQLDISRAEYHAGVAVGWQPSDDVRVGLSLFVVYADMASGGTFWSHLHTPESPGFADVTVLSETHNSLGVVGCHFAGGVQWDVGYGVSLGLQVRTPTFVIATFSEGSQLSSFALNIPSSGEPAVATSSYVDNPDDDAGFTFLRGMRAAAGVSWAFEGGVLALDVDFQLGNDNDLGVETELVWNVRLGAKGFVSDNWVVGGGVFTDRSANRSARELGDLDVDLYGAALAVEWRKQLGLSPSAPPEGGSAEPSTMVLVTNIGVRYAFGVGEAGSFRYAPFADDETSPLVVESGVGVTHHEVAIHVGSGIYF